MKQYDGFDDWQAGRTYEQERERYAYKLNNDPCKVSLLPMKQCDLFWTSLSGRGSMITGRTLISDHMFKWAMDRVLDQARIDAFVRGKGRPMCRWCLDDFRICDCWE